MLWLGNKFIGIMEIFAYLQDFLHCLPSTLNEQKPFQEYSILPITGAPDN